MSKWRVRFTALQSDSALQSDWNALHANGSVFTSWAWIEAWLNTVVDSSAELSVARILDSDGLVSAMALISCHRLRRRGVIVLRQLRVNEWYGDGSNMVIEHNDLISRHPRYIVEQRQALLRALQQSFPQPWDELRWPGAPFEQWPDVSEAVAEEVEPGWAVLRCGEADYLDSSTYLSSNRRQQIRRSMRHYEKLYGELPVLDTPTSMAQALTWFGLMGEMHSRYWRARGWPGAFANPKWVAMHEALIAELWSLNAVRVLRLRSGDQVLGYLYNTRWQGVESSMQSGFDYHNDNRLKPGLIAHSLAVRAAFEQGCSRYDFLMGESSYKASLANHEYRLFWWQCQQPRWHLRFERFLLSVKRTLQKRISER